MRRGVVAVILAMALAASVSAMMVDLDGNPILSVAQVSSQPKGIPYCDELGFASVDAVDPFFFITERELASTASFGGCFIGSTLVQTPTGFREIRDIVVGDYVLAMDVWQQQESRQPSEHFGTQCWSKVDGVYPSTSIEFMAVISAAGLILATPGHPFFVSDTAEYERAYNLSTDMSLVPSWSELPAVRVLEIDPVEMLDPQAVFELKLDAPHNFFVFGSSHGPGVLAHNLKVIM